MLGRTILVVCAFVLVVCEREGRFFSFDFQDRDITVDLDFSIPFVTIPIKNKDTFGASLSRVDTYLKYKKTQLVVVIDGVSESSFLPKTPMGGQGYIIEMPGPPMGGLYVIVWRHLGNVATFQEGSEWVKLPTININPASLALGGAVILGTTVLMPLLMNNYASETGYSRYSRLLENTDFSADAVLSFASQMLADGRGLRGCTLKVACWSAQKHHAFPLKIMSRILNNKLLSMIVNSTAIEDAMLSGSNGRECDSYVPCPLQKKHIPYLMDNLAAFTKRYGLS